MVVRSETYFGIMDILQCTAEGNNAKETAKLLGLSSTSTVYNRMKTAYNEFFQFHDEVKQKRARSVALALRHKKIPGPKRLKVELKLEPTELLLLKLLAEGSSDEEMIKATPGIRSSAGLSKAFSVAIIRNGVRSRIQLMALAIVHGLI